MCSPAVMSAAAACKNSGADASQKCINDVRIHRFIFYNSLYSMMKKFVFISDHG